MGPAMTPEERAALWPYIPEDWQRREQEAWYRARAHAAMEGQPTPSDPQPWPEVPDA